MKSVALVLLNFNGYSLLKTFLADVISNSPEADIILIDNGSTDDSVKWFKSEYPKLKCIQLDKNYGYAGGYNRGLKQLRHNYYALLNTDLWVPYGWLPPLLKELNEKDEVAIVQPHILDYNRKNHFEYSGAAGGYLDKYGFPFCRGRILSTLETDQGQYDATSEVFWASGACFLIKNKVFWKLGAFDSDFFAHQEEIDLCWRAHNEGYKTLAVGKSKVYHIGGGTLAPSPKKVFLNHRNSLYMLSKNLPKQNRCFIILNRLFIDGFIGIYYFLTFKFSRTFAIIRAHFSFYKVSKQMQLKSLGKPKKMNYFFRKNILIDYFIRRTLYFNHLDKKFK